MRTTDPSSAAPTEPPASDPATSGSLLQPVTDFPRSACPRVLAPALIAATLGVALIPHAETTWRVVYGGLKEFGKLDGFFSFSVQLVSSASLATIFILIALFDRRRFSTVLVWLCAYLISAGANESVKHVCGRARPTFTLALDEDGREWIEEHLAENPGSPVKADGTDQWLLFKPGRFIDSNFASFPSGHASSAFVLAAFLWILYPRGRWLWVTLAFGCAFARVRYRRHFPEDVLVGGAMGWTIAHLVFSRAFPVKLANRVAGLANSRRGG